MRWIVLIAFALLAVQLKAATPANVMELMQTLPASLPRHSLESIRIRKVLEVGIEIPIISKFSLNPEVEFYFKRSAKVRGRHKPDSP
jgi:hypothetical protein